MQQLAQMPAHSFQQMAGHIVQSADHQAHQQDIQPQSQEPTNQIQEPVQLQVCSHPRCATRLSYWAGWTLKRGTMLPRIMRPPQFQAFLIPLASCYYYFAWPAKQVSCGACREYAVSNGQFHTNSALGLEVIFTCFLMSCAGSCGRTNR